MNPHRTESARDIAGSLSIRDNNVSPNPNAILGGVGEAEGYSRYQQSSGEEQSTHRRPRGLVYGGASFSLRPSILSQEAQANLRAAGRPAHQVDATPKIPMSQGLPKAYDPS